MSNIIKSLLLVAFVASPLAAQRGAGGGGARGGRQQQVQPPDPTPPPAAVPAKADTNVIRKTPTGYVLDFQDQDIRVVLSAVAEAGDLNITFSNLPVKRVTLRMGKAVSHDDLLDVLRGLAESNGLKFAQTGSFIRIEGTPAVTAQQLQQQQQQAQAAFAAQNQLRLYTYRLKHVSATTVAPVLMNLIIGTGQGSTAVRFNNAQPGVTTITPPFQNNGGGGGGRGGGPGGAAQQAQLNQQNAQAISDAVNALGGAAVAAAAAGPLRQQILQGIQQAGGGAINFGTGAQTQVPAAPGTLSAVSNDIRIVAEESTNSLMIRATAQDYAVLQGIIQTIDLRPLQVLIEVTIAEVQRNKDLSLGISGSGTNHKGGTKDTASASFPSAASARDFILTLSGSKGAVNYDVALNALQTRGDVKVLSMPIIIAQNNKEAILNVGSRQPFVQVSQTVVNDPTGRVQTIQYIDVGKTLTITPTINADGYVNLSVKQTDNNATNEVQFDAPVINTREATTQVFLKNGQTTVIGGLADNSHTKTVSGIPILSRIPFIGGLLFGNTVENNDASELFLFLTPHIISEDADIDRLRDAVKDGSELLQDIPTDGRIKLAQPTPLVRPDSTPAPRTPVRAPARTDTTGRRPPPSEIAGDSAKKVQVPIKKG